MNAARVLRSAQRTIRTPQQVRTMAGGPTGGKVDPGNYVRGVVRPPRIHRFFSPLAALCALLLLP